MRFPVSFTHTFSVSFTHFLRFQCRLRIPYGFQCRLRIYSASQGQLPASRGEEESESGPLIESGPLKAVHLSGHKWPTLRENPCG